jgi:N-acetyl-anhydromuramyl-L-alanine amidase AmpD
VIENGELGHRIRRDFMREVLGGSDVTWSTDLQQCQSLLLQEWAKDQVEEIEAEYAAKLAKKQEKIKEKLLALGYDTDGKKLAF